MNRFQSALSTAGTAESASDVGSAVGMLYEVFRDNEDLLAGYAEVFAHAQRSGAAREQLAEHYFQYRGLIASPLAAQGNENADSIAAMIDGLMVQWMLSPDLCLDLQILEQVVVRLTAK